MSNWLLHLVYLKYLSFPLGFVCLLPVVFYQLGTASVSVSSSDMLNSTPKDAIPVEQAYNMSE